MSGNSAAPMSSAMAASMWSDETIDINSTNLRREIPSMPQVSANIQTVYGAKDAMIYLAYQVLRAEDKLSVVRAVASGIACIYQDGTNYTGSAAPCDQITGLDFPEEESSPDLRSRAVDTNFKGGEKVTFGELEDMIDIDIDELAAYFGVLCLASVKKVTPENRTAFNEKRSDAVRSQSLAELKIFVQNSPFLSDIVLNKVYASFNSMQAPRAHMMSLAASKMGVISMGAPTAFGVMFMLLVDSGMGALRIIKEACLKYPFIRTEFPELKPELALANKAQNAIKKAPSAHRPFLKAIYGSAFVPLPYQETNNLTGICKRVLIETTPTYRNYGGGTITAAQEDKLNRLLIERTSSHSKPAVNAVASAEEEE